MSLTGAIVLYAVTWFMVFFIALQLRVVSQADAGVVLPGTPAGAPAALDMKRKVRVTTAVATVIWAVLFGIIISGWISIRDLDFNGVLGPAPATDGTGG